ncbi:hypothetical protein PENTCL1PPCAC_18971, partial [Pristionchus entomophagus]
TNGGVDAVETVECLVADDIADVIENGEEKDAVGRLCQQVGLELLVRGVNRVEHLLQVTGSRNHA